MSHAHDMRARAAAATNAPPTRTAAPHRREMGCRLPRRPRAGRREQQGRGFYRFLPHHVVHGLLREQNSPDRVLHERRAGMAGVDAHRVPASGAGATS